MRSSLLLLSVLIASPACAQMVQIGAAGAVRGKVQALAPMRNAVGRIISSGKTVYLRDKISTGPNSRLQILLLDETVFTIGPDSSMVLDEFVYDPRTETGKVSARITNGVFKFVTGKVARNKPSDMKIKLPVGTIGIRGTGGLVRASANKSEVILTSPGPQNNVGEKSGALSLTNAGERQDVTRAGYMTTAERGQPPMPAFEAPLHTVLAIAQIFGLGDDGSSGGGSGGAGPAGANEGSASGQSGQDDVDSLGDVSNVDSVNQVTENNDNLTTNANQDTQTEYKLPWLASWDEVRGRSGSGYYSGTGSYACTGGVCGAGCGGKVSFSLNIDFASRSVGGGGSTVYLVDGSLADVNTGLSAVDFTSLSGSAEYSLNAGNSTNSLFYSHPSGATKVRLISTSSQAAEYAQTDILYLDSSNGVTATGGVDKADFY